MYNPFHIGSEPIGIDIGSSGAKLLQLRRGRRGLEAVASARVDMPIDPSESGLDAHLVALADAIKTSVAASGFTSEKCVLSIDDSWLKVRSIRQPRMSDDERDGAVRIDGQQRLGFTPDEPGEVAWAVAGEVRESDAIREEVILTGSRTERLERLVFALAGVGLRPLAIEPGFVASARAMTTRLRRQSDQNVLNMLVDIGSRNTGVMLIRGRDVVFYKPLEFGGERLTNHVASRMGIELETVIDLRRRRMKYGAESSEIDSRVDRAMFDAVRPVMDELAQEIALCLRYYSVTFRGAKPAKCYLIGGEACEPHLTGVIEEATRTATVVGEPLQDINDEHIFGYGQNRRSTRSEWAVAAGLAMRQMEVPSMLWFKNRPQFRRSSQPKQEAA